MILHWKESEKGQSNKKLSSCLRSFTKLLFCEAARNVLAQFQTNSNYVGQLPIIPFALIFPSTQPFPS